MTTLFTSKADLRGINKAAVNYQIEELVQHVAIRIDEGSSTENALSGEFLKINSMIFLTNVQFSAGNLQGRKNAKITIDKPFLFYVRDVVEDIILAAGKIVEIPVEQEIAISFN